MAISDKLTYLNDTKTQLKDMINYGLDTGEKITSETTFRNYVKSLFDAFIKTMTYPDVLYNNLPKVTGEGTSLTLNDTVYAPMKIELKPSALEQETTTGANLVNRTICDEDKGLVWARGDTFSDTNSLVSNYIKVEANESLSFNYKAQVLFYDSSQNYLGALKISSGSATIIVGTGTYENQITIPNVADVYYMRLGFRTSQNDNIDMTAVDIMVNKGSSLLPYEEYTGGIASPNPQYPQTVHTVSGDNTINVIGKNVLDFDAFLNYSNAIYTKNGGTYNITDRGNIITNRYPLNLLPNTTYTLSCEETTNNVSALRVQIYEGGTYLTRVLATGSSEKSATFTTNNSSNYYMNMTFSGDVSYPLVWKNVQLEEGTATTYKPYQSQSYSISLGNLEYCKIGDYEDLFFKNVVGSTYYDSTLELDKWYLKKNIGKVVLDGSEDWVIFNSNSLRVTFRTIINDIEGYTNGNTIPNIISNRFIPNSYNATWVIGNVSRTTSSGGQNFVLFVYEPNTTVEQFETWLSSNNIIAYYVLATQTYTLLSDTLQTQLDNLSKAISYQDQTNVSQTNDDLPFVIKMSAIRDLSGIFEEI